MIIVRLLGLFVWMVALLLARAVGAVGNKIYAGGLLGGHAMLANTENGVMCCRVRDAVRIEGNTNHEG
jgi:hypothetical protein